MRVALESGTGLFVEGQTTSAPKKAGDRDDSILSEEDLTWVTTEMLRKITKVIDRGGIYPILSVDPARKSGEFEIEGGIIYKVHSMFEIATNGDRIVDGRMITIVRKTNEVSERIEFTAVSPNSTHKPRISYLARDKDKTLEPLPNSREALHAARGVVADFSQVNGNLHRMNGQDIRNLK